MINKKDFIQNINKLLYDEEPILSILMELREFIVINTGMDSLSISSGLGREGLYKVLSERGNPYLSTFLAILRGLDLEIEIKEKIRNKKINCLAESHPNLLEIWDFGLNKIRPERVSANSNVKANWICKKNTEHRHIMSIIKKVNNSKCPKCIQIELLELKMGQLLDEINFIKK